MGEGGWALWNSDEASEGGVCEEAELPNTPVSTTPQEYLLLRWGALPGKSTPSFSLTTHALCGEGEKLFPKCWPGWLG